MVRRSFSLAIGCLALCGASALLQAQEAPPAEPLVVDMSPADFRLYRYYLDAVEHASLAGKAEAEQIKAIAKDQNKTAKQLEEVVKRGRTFGGKELAERMASAVRKGLAAEPMNDRLVSVQVDDSEYHAVVYVRWKAHLSLDFAKEASTVAAVVREQVPAAYTLSLAAVRGEKTVFSAQIGHDNMQAINKRSIASFADTRYIRLFENVKGL